MDPFIFTLGSTGAQAKGLQSKGLLRFEMKVFGTYMGERNAI
jgi:hypothetical protein